MMVIEFMDNDKAIESAARRSKLGNNASAARRSSKSKVSRCRGAEPFGAFDESRQPG
jgi:hypothetical protein